MSAFKKLDVNEILKIEAKCIELIEAEELYGVRNEAKLRAVYSSQSYDEFRDIVDAAHLKSITKNDKKNPKTKNRLWNSSAKEI